jgi:uncharacterized protein YdhG (YjbR/CyaY superfamily)
MDKKVREYYRNGSADQKKLFARLEKMILELFPRAEIGIAYGVPTYGTKPARVGLGYWKDGVSFYPYSGSALDEFCRANPTIKTTKGTINFKSSDKVPVAALKKLIRQRMEVRTAR